MTVAFRASRYGRGDNDYLNLPLTRDEYYRFIDALLTAKRVPTYSFERFVPFEGCMPIEEMADRGKETLAFGPMRAVGLSREAAFGPMLWFSCGRRIKKARSITSSVSRQR